ncbi:hypothetical protein NEUTE2DRAFT_61515 [Neurospora tetrasperma FGSC 2509]|nr:hypothetical protein NEUTE2DRAFT_61515 [Neurospora tetrasperma FGSC 2509]
MPRQTTKNSLAQISFGSDPVQPPGQHVADFATLLYVPNAPLPRALSSLDSSSDQDANRFFQETAP